MDYTVAALLMVLTFWAQVDLRRSGDDMGITTLVWCHILALVGPLTAGLLMAPHIEFFHFG